MGHEIFGDRFLGRRQPAWHGLGTVFHEPLSAEQAVVRCGADFDVDLAPCLAYYRGGMVEVPSKCVIMREPTADDPQPRPLGVVSASYQPIQNLEIARLLAPVSEQWPVETVGVLAHGARLFISFDAGVGEIAGEETRDYFLIVDSKDGTKSLTAHYTPVRVVCQNTLAVGISRATTSRSIRHIGDVHARFEEAIDLMRDMRATRVAVQEALEDLARRPITASEVERILAEVYPDPKRPSTWSSAPADRGSIFAAADHDRASDQYATTLYRQKRHRSLVLSLYERLNDTSPRIAGSAYALFNAVVEHADFREGQGGPRKIAQSVVFGARAEEKKRSYLALAAFLN